MDKNGLGLTPQEVEHRLYTLDSILTVLHDTPQVYSRWRKLIVQHDVKGIQAHDARIAVAKQVHGVARLLTYNQRDYARYRKLGLATNTSDPGHVHATCTALPAVIVDFPHCRKQFTSTHNASHESAAACTGSNRNPTNPSTKATMPPSTRVAGADAFNTAFRIPSHPIVCKFKNPYLILTLTLSLFLEIRSGHPTH